MNPPDQPTPRTNAAWAKTFESELNQFWSGNAANKMRDECEKLERELADAKAECERFRLCTLKQDGEIARLRAELAVAENWVEHHSKHADDLIGENVRLRADRRWHPMCQTKNPQMSTTQPTEAQYQLAHIIRQSSTQERAAQLIADSEARAVEAVTTELARLRALFPEILAALRNGAGCTADVSVGFLESVPNEVASVVSRLRAEVERLTAKIGNQADRIRYLEGAINHATGTPLSKAIARAEKAEAELADWSVLNLWGGTPEFVHEFVKGQQNRIHHCQDLEAELITERARLDYLGLHMGMPQVSEALNLPFSQCFPIRDAIDRAMKNETPIP
jgi:hypothetical protein